VKDDRPHHFSLIWKREALPMIPAIGAAIRTVLSASVDNLWIAWMDGDRAYFNFVWQSGSKVLPLTGANFLAKETAKHSRAFSCRPLWDADIHIMRHRLPSLHGGEPFLLMFADSRSLAVFPLGV
jgi:hypothetical protein